jgi:uroporphyrinogen decarboxylase
MTPEPTNQSPQAKPLLGALAGQTVHPAPVWLMRQAGRYLPEYRAIRESAPDFLTTCYTPDLAVEITLQPIRRFGLDAAILFSDILVIPDGLGQEVRFEAGEGPVLAPIGPQDLAGLSLNRMNDHLAPVFETVRRVKASLDAATALIGFAGAPWTLAAYMAEGGGSKDFAAARTWAAEDPASFGHLIDLLTEAVIGLLRRQIDAGADAVQLFDSWAGILSADGFQRWCVAPAAAIVTALGESHPGVPLIGFPRGAGFQYAGYVQATGCAGLQLDHGVPLEQVAELQRRVTVQGNLDPVLLLVGGKAMERQIQAILAALGDGPHIFNLGHGVLPPTPPDHVAQLVEIVRRADRQDAA